MDMYQVLKTLKEVNFNGVIIPDHIPLMGNDPRLGTAFTIGYMKALLDRVNAEVV
jgi:mannonate dehydratase